MEKHCKKSWQKKLNSSHFAQIRSVLGPRLYFLLTALPFQSVALICPGSGPPIVWEDTNGGELGSALLTHSAWGGVARGAVDSPGAPPQEGSGFKSWLRPFCVECECPPNARRGFLPRSEGVQEDTNRACCCTWACVLSQPSLSK